MINNSKLSIQHLWALTVIVGVFVFVNTHPIRPQDFWWHMAVGREIVETGKIPENDEYSYTMAGRPYPSYQIYWLMEAVMFLVFNFGGGEMIIFVQSLVITCAYGIILWLCYKNSKNWRIAALGTLFSVTLGINDWNVRPQAVTFLIGALFLLAIYQIDQTQDKRWLLIFPFGMFVWVNSHGTFIIGYILIGVWWLSEFWEVVRQKGQWKEHLVLPTLALLLSGLAGLLNPQGWEIVRYVRQMTGNSIIQSLVPEWASPSFDTAGGTIFLVGVIISICVLALSPKRPSFFQIFLYVIFLWLGLKTLRGSIWFGLVVAPILSFHIAAIADTYVARSKSVDPKIGNPYLNWMIVVLLILMAIVTLPWLKDYLPLPYQKAGIYSYETPIEATNYLLDKQLPGPLFNAISFGSYLLWEAQPEYPVFVDTRIELFDPEIWTEYILTSNGMGKWQEVLDQYQVETIMASPSEQGGLIKALASSNAWTKVYTDDVAIIYRRTLKP